MRSVVVVAVVVVAVASVVLRSWFALALPCQRYIALCKKSLVPLSLYLFSYYCRRPFNNYLNRPL
jgi:hypothetical protein